MKFIEYNDRIFMINKDFSLIYSLYCPLDKDNNPLLSEAKWFPITLEDEDIRSAIKHKN